MKKNKIIYFLSGLLLGISFLSSCTDLDETVYDKMTAKEFYSNPELIPQAVGAGYTELQGYYNHWGVWGLQTVSSDECVVPTRNPGGDWYDAGVWQNFHQQKWTPSLDKLNDVWTKLYSGVTTCNRILTELNTYKDEMDESVYLKFSAEIIVLRCYYYSLLLDLFGNVPYVDTYESEITSNPQAKRTDIYKKLTETIRSQIDYLDETVTAKNYGRVTQGMAYTLLAKLYLNAKIYKEANAFAQSDMDSVVWACNKVIEGGQYIIENDYRNPFKDANENCKENIFVIPLQAGIGTNADNELRLHLFSLHYSSRLTFNLGTPPWNGGCATPDFIGIYDQSDLRRGYTWLIGDQVKADGSPLYEEGDTGPRLSFTIGITDINNSKKNEGARFHKYEIPLGLPTNMNNDFVLFRYADVFYMKAEAYLRGASGNISSVLTHPDFQKIRQRAGMPEYTASTLTLNEMIKERGREFAWEGMRRQDLVRWDQFAKGTWYAKPAYGNNNRDLFPIPQSQMDKNKSWVQNNWQ